MRLHLRTFYALSVSAVIAAMFLTGCSGGGEVPEAPADSMPSSASSSTEAPATSESAPSAPSSESTSSEPQESEQTDGIKWMYSKNEDGTITLKGYDKTAEKVPSGELRIPEKYDGYVVSAIGYQCLYKNNDIESLVIPNCVQSIGDQAFYQCTNLTSVVLPEGLKKIGTIAFKGTNLDEFTLPKSLASVGSSACEENESLSKVSIK